MADKDIQAFDKGRDKRNFARQGDKRWAQKDQFEGGRGGLMLPPSRNQDIQTQGGALTLGPDQDSSFESFEPNGFPNRADSTLAWSDAAPDRTLTIANAVGGTPYVFYSMGNRFAKATAETIQITDVEGQHFIYYDNAGVLQVVTAFDTELITKYCLVAIVYWDTSVGTAITVADERHGIVMSSASHLYDHLTFGTQWRSGGALGDITADGSGDLAAHATISVATVSIADEDLIFEFSDGVPQDIATPAQIPVYSRVGATDWMKSTADDYPVLTTGTGRMAWNELTGGAWQQTEVSNNNFALSHIWASNDISEPIICVQGQAEYANINAAQDGATTELNSLAQAGLPFVEWTPLGTIIYQTSNGYANAVKSRIRTTGDGDDYVDWRATDTRLAAGAVTSHPSLADLDGGSRFDGGHTFLVPVHEEASTDPTVNDDVDNYKVGTIWVRLDTNESWLCMDNTDGAAVWGKFASGSSGGVFDSTGINDTTWGNNTQVTINWIFDSTSPLNGSMNVQGEIFNFIKTVSAGSVAKTGAIRIYDGAARYIDLTFPTGAGADRAFKFPTGASAVGEQITATDTAGLTEWGRAGFFGDGSLGDVTLGGNLTLTEDRHYRDLSVGNNTVDTAGYRLFCTGTLTIGGSGQVHNDGNVGGASGGAGVPGTPAGGAAKARSPWFGGSGAGGAAGGFPSVGAGTGGGAGTAELTTPTLYPGILLTGAGGGGGAASFDGAPGGNGSAGGTGLAAIGGAGGANPAPGNPPDQGASGGAGGSGGGVCYIAAKVISNSGTISADGGAGGAGTTEGGAGTQSGNGGGGGGGSVIVYSTSASNGTVQANGGAAGVGGFGGAAGAAGIVDWTQIT